MMKDQATAIRREVNQLIELQIEALKQESSLTLSQLSDDYGRSHKITRLYPELDTIARMQLDLGSVRAS